MNTHTQDLAHTIIVKTVSKVLSAAGVHQNGMNVLHLAICLQRLGAACLQVEGVDREEQSVIVAVSAGGETSQSPFQKEGVIAEVFGPLDESAPVMMRAAMHNDIYMNLRTALIEAGITRSTETNIQMGKLLIDAGQDVLRYLGTSAYDRVRSGFRALRDERCRDANRYVFTMVFVPTVTETPADAPATETIPAPTPAVVSDDPNSF